MKVLKPHCTSLLSRCFEFRSATRMVFSVLVMAELGSSRKLYSEKELWQFWAEHGDAEMPLDESIVRTRAEYLISGFAFPHDTEGYGCTVAARVGELGKQLSVFGDRLWQGDSLSKPARFDRMPLSWRQAYGGEGFASNPAGKGAAPVEVDGGLLRFAPNVEDPADLIVTPAQKVTPAGFGAMDASRPQRAKYLGSYDEAWLKNDFPAVASDTDWRFFNTAPEDQQQPAPFRGDEECAFRNMHPVHPLLDARLPGIRSRVFMTHRLQGQDKFKEVAMRLNTLHFFPAAERVILIFQGMHDIAEDDGADVMDVMCAVEHLGRPRADAHYVEVREKRIGREFGAIESLREEDLSPADLSVPLIDFRKVGNRALERGVLRGERERAAARELVSAHGLDPDDGHGPPVKGPAPEEIKSLDDLIRVQKETAAKAPALRAEAEGAKQKNLKEIKAVLERENADFSLIEREMSGVDTRGPPKPWAQDLRDDFAAMIARGKAAGTDVPELADMLGDPEIMARWDDGQRAEMTAYRTTAHWRQPVDSLPDAESDALRQRVLARHAQKAGFRDWDLSGANLAGLDLQGADLAGALMEGVNLTGANLAGANLQDAVLAHATLQSTHCAGADLRNANLGGAHIEKSDLDRANLAGAIFSGATLVEVSWRSARLDGVRLDGASTRALDCTGATASEMLTFYKLDLSGCVFAGAHFSGCTFLECKLEGADFSEARLDKCAFVGVTAPRARFRGLRIQSGCFIQACDLAGTDFSSAEVSNVNFRDARLAGSVFRAAVLQGADFSNCDLSQADFHQADARQARFVRADLTGARLASANLSGAVLQHARLVDTDMRHANLFQSDFARVRVSGNVQVDGALTTRMRTYPRYRAPSEGQLHHG
ncbi:MAG: DUF2169 domain-containing protein [Variovorax sp.]|nr:MAG: DUF2169 domain-containing protein [Variovorax sp.]